MTREHNVTTEVDVTESYSMTTLERPRFRVVAFTSDHQDRLLPHTDVYIHDVESVDDEVNDFSATPTHDAFTVRNLTIRQHDGTTTTIHIFSERPTS